MITVPLQAVPNQTLTLTLNDQVCQINVYQTDYGVFVDLYVNNVLVIGGVIALNLVRIVRSIYLGFIGDLVFQDTHGTDDPDYTGLGSRYLLQYLDPSEIV